jgi:hypothetical protein
MVVDIRKKFLIFEKNHHFSHFFGKNRGKFKKYPDRAGKENVVSTGRYTRPVRNPLPDRTGRSPLPVTTLIYHCKLLKKINIIPFLFFSDLDHNVSVDLALEFTFR